MLRVKSVSRELIRFTLLSADPIKLTYNLMSTGWLAQIKQPAPLSEFSQYTSSPGCWAHCYAELAISSTRQGRNHRQYSLHLPTQGWPDWVAWMNSWMVDQPKVITNPSTNRARRSLTSLTWWTPLPLRQTSHHIQNGGHKRTCYPPTTPS